MDKRSTSPLSGLDDLLASLPGTPKPASKRMRKTPFAEDLKLTQADPDDLCEKCEHGHSVTMFQLRAIALLPNRWYAKHSARSESSCIYAEQPVFFNTLDGKLRTLFGKTFPTTNVLKNAIERLV